MSEPRLLGEILKDYFANSNEPLAVGFRQHFGITQGSNVVKPLEPDSDNSQLSIVKRSSAIASSQLSDWIDNQDVMQLLHISLRTLQTLRSNGTLPYSRIMGKIYYRRQDIQKILADNYTMYRLRNGYGKNR